MCFSFIHCLPTPPAPAQRPPSLLTPGIPLMPTSPGEVHVMVDLPDTPEIVVLSPGDEPMDDLEDRLEDAYREGPED